MTFSAARRTKPRHRLKFMRSKVPSQVRQHCLVLGIRPQELTLAIVNQRYAEWKESVITRHGPSELGEDSVAHKQVRDAYQTILDWLENEEA